MGSYILNVSLLRLPQSPLKLNNILQPSSKANQGQNLRNNNIQTCVQPDSTADENKSNSKSSGNGLLHKHHHSVKKMQTPSVSRRNARERNRVKGVNDGFSFLKKVVPEMKSKSSKVETLRGAINYIKCLRDLLDMEDIDSSKNSNFEVKMESGDDDDDNSTFSELTTEHSSSENSSPETSLRDLSGLHPMVC